MSVCVFSFGLIGFGLIANLEATQTTNLGAGTWFCSLDNVDGTLTLCKTAPPAGTRLYVSQLTASSTTTTGGQLLVRYGTGSACATGTTSLLPAAATAARIGYPASTSAAMVLPFDPPLEVPEGQDLCVICVATNTCSVDLRGWVRP